MKLFTYTPYEYKIESIWCQIHPFWGNSYSNFVFRLFRYAVENEIAKKKWISFLKLNRFYVDVWCLVQRILKEYYLSLHQYFYNVSTLSFTFIELSFNESKTYDTNSVSCHMFRSTFSVQSKLSYFKVYLTSLYTDWKRMTMTIDVN